VSTFREPVIGDDHDLETYGRPAAQRATIHEPKVRERVGYERSTARARRVNSHRPPVADSPARRERSSEQRPSFNDDGVRTVKISGQATPPRRSGAQRSLSVQIDRYDRRPDRAAQWALFMGVFMIVVAIVTGT
jgi:hypothetical protein